MKICDVCGKTNWTHNITSAWLLEQRVDLCTECYRELSSQEKAIDKVIKIGSGLINCEKNGIRKL